MFTYKLNDNGRVLLYGEHVNGVIPDGSEPFGMHNFSEYRKDQVTGQWVRDVVDLIYVIIASELIPSLVDLSAFVEDIDVANQFNVILSTTDITTRNAATYKVPCDVINMTPCKLLAWEDGDDAILQGIVDVWNSQEDYRVIDFPCKFDSYAELEVFKEMQK